MIPILGALVLQAAYGAVDLLVVGRFGSTSGLVCGFHRQPGVKPRHLCCDTARNGRHRPDRPLSRRKETRNRSAPVIGGAAVVFTLLSVCAVRSDGFLCPPHLCTHAGSC